ncbi:rRNA maturation RNase YbeY [Gymnodinialimonas sp. 2305UL16-5]|uniref:rRNA maturation RNase YbeY n=1 Tax=Gymnodinialimonas mytili TaxID=3126503 RepID=UPI0030AD8AC0
MEIDVLIEDPAWDAVDLEAVAETALPAVLRALDLPPARFAVSLLGCDDDRIAGLNAEFRGKATPTNVLSWPSEERAPSPPGAMPDPPKAPDDGPPLELGDIAIAYATCAREAAAAGKPLSHHLTHLLIHGLLHCLGYDHETDPDAALMEALETRILASLGVPDPY